MARSVSTLALVLVSLAVACGNSSGLSSARAGSGGAATGGVPAVGGSATGTSGASSSSGGTVAVGANGGGNAGGSNAVGGTSASGGNNASGGTTSTGSGGQLANAGSGGATACGYMNQGHVLNVAADISLCIPPQHCLPETCPPTLGKCVNDECVYDAGYEGLATLPQAWATHYCDLQSGACQGVDQLDPVLTTAQKVATQANLPLCKSSSAGAKCVGIVANPPMMEGNREKYGENWGLGLTEPSGLCYEVSGPGGSALLAVTDRCGGYCKCPSVGVDAYNECGQCKEATDLTPLCECRGDNSCPTEQCDWCAANNHPHFDVDDDTFNHICGDQAIQGSCQLANVKFVPCLAPRTDWPPAL